MTGVEKTCGRSRRAVSTWKRTAKEKTTDARIVAVKTPSNTSLCYHTSSARSVPLSASPFDSSDKTDSQGNAGAYLILRSGSRWSDVFRLSPPVGAVIGRASSSQIVIRSDQASRQHARIDWDGGRWMLQDLGSRNGTFLDGTRIESPHPLADGSVIGVAGFAIQFSHRIEISSAPAAGSDDGSITDDQMTLAVDEGFDAGSITDRRRHSRYLAASASRGKVGMQPDSADGESARSRLLQLAFALARADSTADAIDQMLEALTSAVPLDTVGVYVWERTSKQPTAETASLVATRQRSTRSYRRPPTSLVENIVGGERQAILARNILGDTNLASHNSQGEIEVESVIVAPIQQRDARLIGFVHLTTGVGAPPFDSDSLEFAVAAAEILAESLVGIAARQRLSKNLKRSRRHIEQLQAQLGDRVRMIGASSAMQDLSQKISLTGPTGATVLIRGESGVGKELVAAAIHQCSPRRDFAMLCINCAALSPTLLESELFGHEKGAFTGATDRKLGKFEAADGGTLLLDEIGEMSADTQAKFLRVLEGHAFERVGGHVPVRADVRVVAATNRDLQAMVREGKFRQDLYYRLHVVEIIVPPLRQRGDDCLLIAEEFLERFNREMNRRIRGLTDDARSKLLAYDWPGNIRELKNVIERAVVLGTGEWIDADDLLLSPSLSPESMKQGTALDHADQNTQVELTLAQLEQQHIERVLRYTQGNKSRAASVLGIERSTLDRKLKRFA